MCCWLVCVLSSTATPGAFQQCSRSVSSPMPVHRQVCSVLRQVFALFLAELPGFSNDPIFNFSKVSFEWRFAADLSCPSLFESFRILLRNHIPSIKATDDGIEQYWPKYWCLPCSTCYQLPKSHGVIDQHSVRPEVWTIVSSTQSLASMCFFSLSMRLWWESFI